MRAIAKATLTAALLLVQPVFAQSPFSAAVTVNDRAVTYWEIDQRVLFLTLLNAPGNIAEEAYETLIDERLQIDIAERLGVLATDEELQEGLAEFAARVNLGPEEFIRQLEARGVAAQTFRDFVFAGVTWRNVLRSQFGARAQVTEEEVDRALALAAIEGGAQILMAEIVIPINAQNQEQARVLATQISESTDGSVDYVIVPIAGGRSDAALAEAEALRNTLDTCDDLFGVRPGGFQREVLQVADVPEAIAAELIGLDANEVSTDLTLPTGELMFLMLCGRTTELPEGARDQVRAALVSQRMETYGDGFMAELREDAIIREAQ